MTLDPPTLALPMLDPKTLDLYNKKTTLKPRRSNLRTLDLSLLREYDGGKINSKRCTLKAGNIRKL